MLPCTIIPCTIIIGRNAFKDIFYAKQKENTVVKLHRYNYKNYNIHFDAKNFIIMCL